MVKVSIDIECSQKRLGASCRTRLKRPCGVNRHVGSSPTCQLLLQIPRKHMRCTIRSNQIKSDQNRRHQPNRCRADSARTSETVCLAWPRMRVSVSSMESMDSTANGRTVSTRSEISMSWSATSWPCFEPSERRWRRAVGASPWDEHSVA